MHNYFWDLETTFLIYQRKIQVLTTQTIYKLSFDGGRVWHQVALPGDAWGGIS